MSWALSAFLVVPPPCAPTNGRPGFPFGFLGDSGRLQKAQRGRFFIAQFFFFLRLQFKKPRLCVGAWAWAFCFCCYRTPPPVGPWCRRNLIPRRPNSAKNQTGLPGPNPKPTPAWLGGWMRWRHAITKKQPCLFVRFFTCSQNTKMATFSLISKVFGHV